MLQPREFLSSTAVLLVAVLVLVHCVTGVDRSFSPRRRRQDGEDVTTVLLVDNHDRSSLGRFLNVKPDLGLIISTARTFIQEGVTTEYATQVLGTTLDNGRLYAHLLTKSSRVLYDKDVVPTRSQDEFKKKWNVDENLVNKKNFLKNTDYITPSRPEAILVFPTVRPDVVEDNAVAVSGAAGNEEEILKSSPSNNPYQGKESYKRSQNNVKVFQINPQKDIQKESRRVAKELGENEIVKDGFLSPSKVKALDNLPTFTVRNEFSPSGYSFLGDIPAFDVNTERSKPTTVAERRAKFLFKAGLAKPEPKDLKTVTYSGFADFTTTVGDTVIIFSPHTSEVPNNNQGQVTKISVEPTIKPTPSQLNQHTSTPKPQEPQRSSMIIGASDRHKDKTPVEDQNEDLEAKLSVLAHEQKVTPELPKITSPTTILSYTPDAIQPSESLPHMLSTPSDEDIAKIVASLQAQAKQATQPLNNAATIFFDEQPVTEPQTQQVLGGATTIFFDDDLPVQATGVLNEEVITEKVTEPPPVTTTTEDVPVVTTEGKQETTTEEEEPLTTTESKDVESTTVQAEEEIEEQPLCVDGSKIVPSTVYKTLTYLTTFFIPQDDTTTTSIRSNEVVSKEVNLQTIGCYPQETLTTTPKVVEEPTTLQEQPTTQQQPVVTTEEEQEVTTIPSEVTTIEHYEVTESEPETTETTTEDGEELELIFKTLYTTYTYLTTYFQDSTSSVASRIVVTTNVITSTIDPSAQASDPAVAGLLNEGSSGVFKSKAISFEDFEDIAPTSVGIGRPTELMSLADQDGGDNVLEHYPVEATPALEGSDVQQTRAAVKTYYTTYTYFTTIFVDGETEISSRTEVFTNYVTPSAADDVRLENLVPTKLPSLKDSTDKEFLKNLHLDSVKSYNSTIKRSKVEATEVADEIATTTPNELESSYVTLQRGSTENTNVEDNYLNLMDYETIATMVTDVRSSTSEGGRRIIDSLDKRNVLVDDQVVSESNNDSEIIPSPTLLLQTSYTTFTYFTTMYHGTTSSNVVSRLETITNIVTETLTPTHILSPEDMSLPITYFTTFTYWTTLYKDGSTKIQSREETVSNVVTPSAIVSTERVKATPSPSEEINPTTVAPEVLPSSVVNDDLTTYFTTYTYYTTSYVGDSTVIKSRLETVSNVLNNTVEVEPPAVTLAAKTPEIQPSKVPTGESKVGLLSTVVNSLVNDDKTTFYTTNVIGTFIDGIYAQVLESSSSVATPKIEPSSVEQHVKPTGVVSLNQGKIVDADGISTLFYTTQAVGAYINNSYAQIIASTSSLKIDEEKKAALPTDVPPVLHRTGLVRLIEGSIVQNNTTTLYQSKVLGTVIDNRYAQIIESTSSFIVNKPKENSITPTSVNEIVPTPTKAPQDKIVPTKTPISPSPVAIEGSISDSSKIDDELSTEEPEGDEDGDDDNSRTKSRLTFQTRKRTFSPVIRPFASRPRPTFAPSRKKVGPTSAVTVSRSDFTPTITVVPASKPGRFGGGRKSSAVNANAINPTASSGRRFSRPKSNSVGGTSRGRASSKISPTSSRRGGFKSSVVASSAIRGGSSSRYRIRPTSASNLNRSPASSAVTPASNEDENDLTTQLTESPEENETTLVTSTTTESISRRQNPLLRFRRPPISRPSTTPRSPSKSASRGTARSGNRATSTTTTTPRPKSAYSRSNLARPRPANALFPRKNLFTTSTTTTPPPEEEESLEEEGEEGEELDDTEYESSDTESKTEVPPENTTPSTRRGRGSAVSIGSVKIRPFQGIRRRSKRETTYSRFRRPTARSSSTTSASSREVEEQPESEPTPKSSFRTPKNNRFSRNRSTTTPPKRISPTKPTTQARAQFTLRERDSSTPRSNFRRPSTASSRTRATTTSSRTKASRLRNGQQQQSDTSSYRRTNSRGSRRPTSRQRQSSREQIDSNNILPDFDGTITVTHQIPTEITIPVVNGRVTEYKNIVTARPSTEVLGPQQYTTSINGLGKEITVLLSDASSIDGNGATLVTQFILNEAPTTSILFTPTYIRGRKTSFSHVVPSTAYAVEQVVNTIQPALAAQAPLANILLSQLLLGGLQQPNPVLGLQNPALQQIPTTPTTEFKTRTTTYVTTVTSEASTVLPLTFRGKEILTTIVDKNVQVLTATEFITDTVVVTPTVGLPVVNNQLNSLLVPLLLQQQQQQQQTQNIDLFSLNNANQPFAQPLVHEPEKINLAIADDYSLEENENDSEQLVSQEEIVTKPPRRKNSRKKPKKPVPTEPPKETSVITLYVSGRTPEEFSTVLSTVVVGEEGKKKREATYLPVMASKALESFDDPYLSAGISEAESVEMVSETESLESIIGDVSKHVKATEKWDNKYGPSKKYKYVKASKMNNLGESAPLTPKVETLHGRGIYEHIGKNVSNLTGSRKFKRQKRHIFDELETSADRRVVKKLIRVEPVTDRSDEEDYEIQTETARKLKRRRKLVIKKKKKIIPTPPRRRKVVITRKRLVNATTPIPQEDFGNTLQSTESDLDYTTEDTSEETTTQDTESVFTNLDAGESITNSTTLQDLPEYEPFFPELSEPLDDPVLLLKTTVLSSINYDTKTIIQSKLRTYTFLITRVNGDEKEVTSTTEIKPHTKTIVVTEPRTEYTTLTLLDLDSTKTLPFVPLTANPFVDPLQRPDEEKGKGTLQEEARHNLATRVMSNGVEVIVRGDKSTLPGEPDVLRKLPSTIYKPVTLRPSTLSDHMMMVVPQESSVDFYPNQFVTKTCLTTFTYLTTYLESGSTVVSSHEKVISNIATEERNTGKILPTPSMGITLTQYPNLAVGVFVTTYTYLNTILDGEQPLVVTSKHIVSNTVTAPDDYLSMLQPADKATPQKDTNTYYSTLSLLKTVKDGDESKVISTTEVVTQVVITESVPPKPTSVMTSYIALDADEMKLKSEYTTTEVLKTYYVTYTYYNTVKENDKITVHTNVSTSSDVVTETLYLNPKKQQIKPSSKSVIKEKPDEGSSVRPPLDFSNLRILAEKTYLTTFTYFTTLLQEDKDKTSTVISSHTKVVQEVVTDTIEPSLLNKQYLSDLKEMISQSSVLNPQLATLSNGQKVEVTLVDKDSQTISPTKVLPIEKTKMPETTNDFTISSSEYTTPSVITGSTIIFFDDEVSETESTVVATPSLAVKVTKSTKVKNNLNSMLSSEIVKKTKNSVSTKPASKTPSKTTKKPSVSPTKPIKQTDTTNAVKDANEKKKPYSKINSPTTQVSDLLGLGSININSLQALTPVLSAMAGLIQTNLKPQKAAETTTVKPKATPEGRHPIKPIPAAAAADSQNRSPIYIPVGSVSDDLQGAESHNIPSVYKPFKNQIDIGQPTHESPLLNGGIPISPGEVITANSDVIVGKPGRVGPRRPPIPLDSGAGEHLAVGSEIAPIGMKPPPLVAKNWPKRHLNANNAESGGNFLRPPPLPSMDHKQIPLRPQESHPKIQQTYYESSLKNIKNQVHKEEQANKQFGQFSNLGQNLNTHQTPVVLAPKFQRPLQPLIVNEPLAFPEVVERVTGQPLLVNIQPSQVAFVNIPHNRTTALIFGGSTEPHRNGQYFDDPSPYRDASSVSYDERPKFTSLYHNMETANQKQVGGVIKVVPHFIDHKQDTDVLLQIQPSKPISKSDNIPEVQSIGFDSQHGNNWRNVNLPSVNMKAPSLEMNGGQTVEMNKVPQVEMNTPISFGMFQQGNDFNAHIIKHEMKNGHEKYPNFDNNRVRQRPTQPGLVDYMTPPTPPKTYGTQKIPTTVTTTVRSQPAKNPRPIPFELVNNLATRRYPTHRPTEQNVRIKVQTERQKATTFRPTVTTPTEKKTKTHPTRPSILSNPRPFHKEPIVRPENQQTNQVNHNESDTQYQIYISYRPDPNSNSVQTEKMPAIFGFESSTTTTTTPKPTKSTSKPHREDIRENLVTSLPIDSNIERVHTYRESQTEKPFGPSKKTPPVKPTVSEVEVTTVLKPPPLVLENSVLVKEPETEMRPPSVVLQRPGIELNSPSGGIKKVPSLEKPLFDLEAHANTPQPYVPRPSQEMVPPPPEVSKSEEVVGMEPPTTKRVVVEIGKVVTTRKPLRRRPVYIRRNSTTRRPEQRFTTLRSIHKPILVTQDPVKISPSPVLHMKPASEVEPNMEVIIGRPHLNFNKPENTTSTERTLNTTEATTQSVSTSSEQSNVTFIHHGGNEIQIVEETNIPTEPLPTKYITYTKTSTVTITKTTIIKTPGGPPSTLTILVTKTDKITIVDTVTEFHTLVKPTSIVETVTTTITPQPSSLYPPDASYGQIPTTILPSIPLSSSPEPNSIENESDDLDAYIIRDTDAPPVEDSMQDGSDESIFVVMTDENKGSIVHIPPKYETGNRDEMVTHEEGSNVLLGGVLIASPPSLETPDSAPTDLTTKCEPECKATRNELCQKNEGLMRCVCRPGFARMFPDRPCKPTYTYKLKIGLDRYGKQQLRFSEDLTNTTSPAYNKMAVVAHDGLDRMVMQSDLRDIYHGVHVNSFEPSPTGKGIVNNFYLQLSDNTDEQRLSEVFKKYLRHSNFSLGGTELFASEETVNTLRAEDFDECSNQRFHDCSEHAQCFNLKGTYTCSCKEGFSDLSENILYPGRVCSADLIGCERCHYHGTCYNKGEDQFCECFQWYAGEYCHVNLKVLLIALVTLGSILFVLLLICVVMTCTRKSTNPGMANGMSFLPQRVSAQGARRTLERRAMIQDTSSESGQSETSVPAATAKKKLKGALKKQTKHSMEAESNENTMSFPDQKDRSLTVMIPRAKYHPAPPTSPLLSMSTFDKRKMSAASSNEAKLLSYLDAGPSPNKSEPNRKFSSCHSDTLINCKSNLRKTSGALVSAGFEVSATVVANNLGTLEICGTEADRSENATLIQKISADLLSSTGTRSQFNTLRHFSDANDDDVLDNWLDLNQRIATISEARSCDETTIPPTLKSFRNDYDSKHSSQHLNDEANTMAERDLGSTFLLPHMHLYKPERGSDASGFESI